MIGKYYKYSLWHCFEILFEAKGESNVFHWSKTMFFLVCFHKENSWTKVFWMNALQFSVSLKLEVKCYFFCSFSSFNDSTSELEMSLDQASTMPQPPRPHHSPLEIRIPTPPPKTPDFPLNPEVKPVSPNPFSSKWSTASSNISQPSSSQILSRLMENSQKSSSQQKTFEDGLRIKTQRK